MFLAGIANESLGKLESETREPDCIVSNTLSIGRIERTFVFNFFAVRSAMAARVPDLKATAEVKDKYQEYFKERSKTRQCSMRTTSEKQNNRSFINQFGQPYRHDPTALGRPESLET